MRVYFITKCVRYCKTCRLHYKTRQVLKNAVSNKAKGGITKRVFQENKERQIFQKTNISYLLIRTQGGKKCFFFGKPGVLCFLKTPFLKFALLSYYRRYVNYYKTGYGIKHEVSSILYVLSEYGNILTRKVPNTDTF